MTRAEIPGETNGQSPPGGAGEGEYSNRKNSEQRGSPSFFFFFFVGEGEKCHVQSPGGKTLKTESLNQRS